jgi:hypothetical protein
MKKYTLLGVEKVSPSEPKKEFGAQNQYGRVIYPSIGNFTWTMDGWMNCQWGVALLHAGHKTGLICTTVYL